MINSRLGTLEGKPINGGVTSIMLATLHETGLETACRHIFHPHKSCVMDSRWFVSMINWSKYSHGSATWKADAEWFIFTMEIIVSHLLNVNFPNLNAYNREGQKVWYVFRETRDNWNLRNTLKKRICFSRASEVIRRSFLVPLHSQFTLFVIDIDPDAQCHFDLISLIDVTQTKRWNHGVQESWLLEKRGNGNWFETSGVEESGRWNSSFRLSETNLRETSCTTSESRNRGSNARCRDFTVY